MFNSVFSWEESICWSKNLQLQVKGHYTISGPACPCFTGLIPWQTEKSQVAQKCTAGKHIILPPFLFHCAILPGSSVSKQCLHSENRLTKHELTTVTHNGTGDAFHTGKSCLFWINEESMDWGLAQFLHFLFRPHASYPGKWSVVPAGTEGSTKCSVSSETPSREATFEMHDMLAIKQTRAELRVLLWFPMSRNPSWLPSKEQWSCRDYWRSTVGCLFSKSLLRVLIKCHTVKWRKSLQILYVRVGQN